MHAYPELIQILNREVRLAEARLKAARENVEALTHQNGGPPLAQPEKLNKITAAIKERIAASGELERAVKRNVAFALDGVVPDDLK